MHRWLRLMHTRNKLWRMWTRILFISGNYLWPMHFLLWYL